MKIKILFSTLLLSVCFFAQAQLTISTNLREEGRYNDNNKKWEITSTQEGLTVFNFNRKLTSFRHITATLSSIYKIDQQTYDDEEVKYTMQVTSDAGNHYDLIIDGANNFVAFFFYDADSNYRMVKHTISKTWFDKEEEESK